MVYVFTIQVDGEIKEVHTFTDLDVAKKFMVNAIFLSDNDDATFTQTMIQKEMKNKLPCVKDGLWIYKIHESGMNNYDSETDSEESSQIEIYSIANGKSTFGIGGHEVIIEYEDEAISFDISNQQEWKKFIETVVETGKGSYKNSEKEKIEISGKTVKMLVGDISKSTKDNTFVFTAKKGELKVMLQKVLKNM